MSMFANFFQPKSAAQPAANQQQGSANQQQPNNQAGNDQGGATLPNNAQIPDKPVDPLAPFAKMYDTAKEAVTPPKFALDSKALTEAANAVNFMSGADPKLIQAAEAGDSKSIMQLIEHVGRNAYQHALSHGSVLTDRFTDAREAFNNQGFSGKVKGELAINALTGTPNFGNPVVRKELAKVAGDIQRQHPDASPQEVADMARDYITKLGRAINPETPTQAANNSAEVTDWNKWFDEEHA